MCSMGDWPAGAEGRKKEPPAPLPSVLGGGRGERGLSVVALGDRGAGVRELWQQGPRAGWAQAFSTLDRAEAWSGQPPGSALPGPLGVPLQAGLQGKPGVMVTVAGLACSGDATCDPDMEQWPQPLTDCTAGRAWLEDRGLNEAGAPLHSGGAETWRDHPGDGAS